MKCAGSYVSSHRPIPDQQRRSIMECRYKVPNIDKILFEINFTECEHGTGELVDIITSSTRRYWAQK